MEKWKICSDRDSGLREIREVLNSWFILPFSAEQSSRTIVMRVRNEGRGKQRMKE
jgi:hypothetical protein